MNNPAAHQSIHRKITMTHFMAAFAVALTFALQSANAQDDVGRFYLGGNIGQVEADDFCVSDGTIDGITFTTSCDDKDTGAKLYGGYNIHKNFAVEIGYIDFGESQITISNVDRVVRGRTTTKESTNSFFFAGIGKIHVHPKVSIFGKIGLHRWDAEYRWKSRHIADVTYGPRSFAFNGKSN